MILQFVFKTPNENLVLPKNYNQILQGFFYRHMDKELAQFLHNRGFSLGKRTFKLFVFSKIFGKLLKKENGNLYYLPKFRIYFASPRNDITIGTLKEFILSREGLFLGKNPVEVIAVNPLLVENFENTLKVKTISPIVVYKTKPGERYHYYLTPFEEEFYKLLIENLKKKYILVYGKPFEGEIEIKPLKVSERDFKKVVFKGKLIKAWSGVFEINAPKEVIKLALETGLGTKNSAGFGMVLPIGMKV
jgi:CRISPR-associated endoribonuclease Cas6